MSINETQEIELDRFIDSLRSGKLDESEMTKLDERLREDADFRQLYRARVRMESNLLSVYQLEEKAITPPVITNTKTRNLRSFWYMAAGAGIAATLILSFLTLFQEAKTPIIPAVAKIEVESEASWAGMLPFTANGDLGAGEIYLKTGVAEIRFVSGVRVSLEAPARLDVINPMRCRLIEGNIIVEVPDGAEGFIVDTPEGHAVDYGTNFAVTVNNENQTSKFVVINGEIAVHHKSTQISKTLLTGESVRLTKKDIVTVKPSFGKESNTQTLNNSLRLRTNGRETSIVRNDQRELWLSPDLLMVKADVRMKNENSLSPILLPKERRSLIGFNLGGLNTQRIHSAKFRLNIVPSGLGFASFLPDTCHFEVYGIKEKPNLESWWTTTLKWRDAPGSIVGGVEIDYSEVDLLGTFDIPKGRLEGSVIFTTDRLIKYLKNDTTDEVGFLIVMTTIPKKQWSLVHAFASSTHHNAAGPSLEIELEE